MTQKQKEIQEYFYYKKKRHIIYDCYKKKADKQKQKTNKKPDKKPDKKTNKDPLKDKSSNKQNLETQAFSIMVVLKNGLEKWFLDTGASNHIIRQQNILFDYKII